MFGRKSLVCGVCLAVLVLVASSLFADVQLHGLFTDNMVLQQGIEAPIWGQADDGEAVTVKFCGQAVSADTKDGKWMVRLKPLKAGGPHTMTVSGKNTVELKNVLVGEVWVCSGQSNMAMPVRGCVNPEQEIANSSQPIEPPKQRAASAGGGISVDTRAPNAGSFVRRTGDTHERPTAHRRIHT